MVVPSADVTEPVVSSMLLVLSLILFGFRRRPMLAR